MTEPMPSGREKRDRRKLAKKVDGKYGTKFSSKPGQKVKKLYWDPETKKYYPRPKRPENKYRSVDKPQKPRKATATRTKQKATRINVKYFSPEGVGPGGIYRKKKSVEVRKYRHGGTVTGGIKKIQHSGKHWNKDIG